MDRIVFVGVLAVWLAGCSGPAPAPPPAAEPGITPIVGRSAATNIAMNLHVQKLIREGKLDEALSDLESTLPGHLALMHWAEPVMPASDVYFRLRDRDLRSLKQHWLEHPPTSSPTNSSPTSTPRARASETACKAASARSTPKPTWTPTSRALPTREAHRRRHSRDQTPYGTCPTDAFPHFSGCAKCCGRAGGISGDMIEKDDSTASCVW